MSFMVRIRILSSYIPRAWFYTVFLLITTVVLILKLNITQLQSSESSLFSNSDSDLYINFAPMTKPAPRGQNITILVVLDAKSDPTEYRFSLKTLQCYSEMHSYELRIVVDSDYKHICKQKDYMFRRHCIAAKLLTSSEWLLFLDADIAVVNPKRLIEEYIDPSYDITFYDRFTSWEVAMGSYLVKNTQWSRNFLMDFADYEKQLPDSFHGTDNGAIHMFILERVAPELAESAAICRSIWNQSNTWDTLFLYENCVRLVIGAKRNFENLRIMPKARGWVRDGWLTESKWSPERDFMLHGYKEAYREGSSVDSRFTWIPFLTEELDTQLHCSSPLANWPYSKELMTSSAVLHGELRAKYLQVERRNWRLVGRIADYF